MWLGPWVRGPIRYLLLRSWYVMLWWFLLTPHTPQTVTIAGMLLIADLVSLSLVLWINRLYYYQVYCPQGCRPSNPCLVFFLSFSIVGKIVCMYVVRSRGFEYGHCLFEPWSSQTNDFNWYLSFLSQVLDIIWIGQGLVGQCQDNMTEWDSRSVNPERQHYKINMSAHLSQIATHPDMTLYVA